MSNFKVGQRVRIIAPESIHFHKEATILEVIYDNYLINPHSHDTLQYHKVFYEVDIDGHGTQSRNGGTLAYLASDLAPLNDPDFKEFMEKIQKPITTNALELV